MQSNPLQDWTLSAEAAALLAKAATAAIDGDLRRYGQLRSELFVMRNGQAATGTPSLAEALRDTVARVKAEREAADAIDGYEPARRAA